MKKARDYGPFSFNGTWFEITYAPKYIHPKNRWSNPYPGLHHTVHRSCHCSGEFLGGGMAITCSQKYSYYTFKWFIHNSE